MSPHNGRACWWKQLHAHARTRALTFAGLGVGLEDESFGAGAGVGARSVPAQAVVTEQTVHQALVDVCGEASGERRNAPGKVTILFPHPLTHAGFAAGVGLVADVTDAAVASSQVLTDAVLTDVWVQGALVDVWGRTPRL